MKNSRICFAGTPEFAIPVLEMLVKEAEVPLVITMPDKKRSRGKISPTPVKQRAMELGIDVIAPDNVNDPAVLEQLRAYDFDFIVEVAYGKLLKPEFLALAPDRVLNVHPSLLPKYRGAAPLVWPILAGDEESGTSIMLVDEGMDTGDVLYQTRIDIRGMNAQTLHDVLAEDGAKALKTVLDDYESYYRSRMTQTEPSSYAKKIEKEMGALDFKEPAEILLRKVRGLNPRPGTYFHINEKRMQVLSMEPLDESAEAPPGTVYRADETGIYINTATVPVRITRVKPAGKKEMTAADYLRGNPIQIPVSLH